MAPSVPQIEIPNRALFKAAEVCDLVKVQPYVLRTWEAEFPELGISKNGNGPRVYRRSDVEQVARIKHLLLVEGLTLAGARRRLDEEAGPVAPDEPALDELIGENARQRLTEVKRGLRSILDLLARDQVVAVVREATQQPLLPGHRSLQKAKPTARKSLAAKRVPVRRKRSS